LSAHIAKLQRCAADAREIDRSGLEGPLENTSPVPIALQAIEARQSLPARSCKRPATDPLSPECCGPKPWIEAANSDRIIITYLAIAFADTLTRIAVLNKEHNFRGHEGNCAFVVTCLATCSGRQA
jgi:hypothetical protein